MSDYPCASVDHVKAELKQILFHLQTLNDLRCKNEYLKALPKVKDYLNLRPDLDIFLDQLSQEEKESFLSFLAIGQGQKILGLKINLGKSDNLLKIANELLSLQRSFKSLGGIVGYQNLVYQMLSDSQNHSYPCHFSVPDVEDLSKLTPEVKKYVYLGIRDLDQMSEIYPVGGAGDRLNLISEQGGALPAAKLPFLGKSLLEGLINDLQAREFLHFQIFHKQLNVPIALMTSEEKNNADHISAICKKNRYFGRDCETFFFFNQPLVPVFTKEGDWRVDSSGSILRKPGGHGVIWKLAKDQKIYEKLKNLRAKKALIRQINNPIAGFDYTLAAFCGMGLSKEMKFGFVSCPRTAKAKEGMSVLKFDPKTRERVLTCVEYCDFERYQICSSGNRRREYMSYPANVNILFADLDAVDNAAEEQPYPNKIINFKEVIYEDQNHFIKKENLARIECTMQNISEAPTFKNNRAVYLTCSERLKTISAIKKHMSDPDNLLETVEGCYADYVKNCQTLLQKCGFQTPGVAEPVNPLNPPFIFTFHPSLGPFYSLITQKLRGGKISRGSELQCEAADVLAENLSLDGSLIIHAKQIMGHFDCGKLIYSGKTGKCVLRQVQINNRGIKNDASNVFWKNEIARNESTEILLEGNSVFYAHNVSLEGPLKFIVPDNQMMIVTQNEGRLIQKIVNLPREGFALYEYEVGHEYNLTLKKAAAEVLPS